MTKTLLPQSQWRALELVALAADQKINLNPVIAGKLLDDFDIKNFGDAVDYMARGGDFAGESEHSVNYTTVLQAALAAYANDSSVDNVALEHFPFGTNGSNGTAKPRGRKKAKANPDEDIAPSQEPASQEKIGEDGNGPDAVATDQAESPAEDAPASEATAADVPLKPSPTTGVGDERRLRSIVNVPVDFGGVSIGESTARLGVKISRTHLNLVAADEIFCGHRLTGRVLLGGSDDDQYQMTMFRDGEIAIDGSFDVKGIRVTADEMSTGLTFSLADIDVAILARFSKGKGRVIVSHVADISADASDDDDESDMSEGDASEDDVSEDAAQVDNDECESSGVADDPGGWTASNWRVAPVTVLNLTAKQLANAIALKCDLCGQLFDLPEPPKRLHSKLIAWLEACQIDTAAETAKSEAANDAVIGTPVIETQVIKTPGMPSRVQLTADINDTLVDGLEFDVVRHVGQCPVILCPNGGELCLINESSYDVLERWPGGSSTE